jgi:hypothetical protein
MDLVLTSSRKNPVFGVIVSILLFIGAVILFGNPKALFGMAPIFGILALLLMGLTALVTFVGVVSRLGSGVKSTRRDFSVPTRHVFPPPLPPSAPSTPSTGHFGPFSTRRERLENIDKTVRKWNEEPKPPPALARPPAPAQAPVRLPYRRTSGILSKGERAFWGALYHAVKGKYRIFCKVRLADIVCCPDRRADERMWFKKIGRFHVDFVICEPKSTRPLLVIELDDRSHRTRSKRRQERDQWKDDVLRAAGVPVHRVRAQQAYDVAELRQAVEHIVATYHS